MQLHIIFIFRPRIRLKNPRVFKKLDFFALTGERKLFSPALQTARRRRGGSSAAGRFAWYGPAATHTTPPAVFLKRERVVKRERGDFLFA